MLNICISFDHEIYFGENYFSEEEILIIPSYKLMDVLVGNNISGTFFTDICSVFRYKSLGMNTYPELMDKQLKTLIENKQDVQLHIHSHWYNSNYVNGKWCFDDASYKIHSFGFGNSVSGELNGNKIIRDGKLYLETLLKTVDENYKCIAFRAGGFCLQPENDLLEVLLDNGIIIDSSIVKNLHSEIKNHSFSFIDLPNDLNWWIEPKKGIKSKVMPNARRVIFEIPIGSINKKPIKWLLSKRNRPMINPIKRGSFFAVERPVLNQAQKTIKRFKEIWSSPLLLSLDYYRDDVLIGITKEFLKEYDCINNDYYISVICHPKLMGDDHISNMDSFIKKAKKLSPNIGFSSMLEAYNNISNLNEQNINNIPNV